ncbi:DUF3880 domain-containing protein [Kineothrix sp. MB12-C1]|uniref:DUF3880 domain-containing protein n=1 Tax=Kineothrix sp. MB12-C1 TaxID=3070215 RepID=UPI0027D2CC7B|nr:DUF3880 domain-containing protein [Kineothrix sp. MB12-C1]WMC93879.1 DUF3880 domain-containing protein [Kineothrix sp. MB12-C1]
MLEVLFLKGDFPEERQVLNQLKLSDCNIVIYSWDGDEEKLGRTLREKTYHFVFTVNYISLVAGVCKKISTKYVSWVYNAFLLLDDLRNIGEYTNYIFLNDNALYKDFVARGCKRIFFLPLGEVEDIRNYGYYIQFMFSVLFKEGELDVFDAMQRLEAVRKRNDNRCWIQEINSCFKDYRNIKSTTTDEIYYLMKEEKEATFFLKGKLIDYINRLLKDKDINILLEIIMWYNRNYSGELHASCWEFTCLLIFLNISIEEMSKNNGVGISSILQYDSLEEICHTYLQTVFYLRRIEYDIDLGEEKEILCYIAQERLSETALEYIIKEARIFDKSKVNKRLQELRRQYGNE